VLADALSFAADEKPCAIVDIATLTGAVAIALGSHCSAVLGNNDGLKQALIDTGNRCGDRLWPLPLWPEHDEMLKTPFADIRNIGDGSAGTIAGAAFLKHFVADKTPWAHVDIAATAWLETEKPYSTPGATLFGARLLADWIEGL
jgi:leucyl aminopeptidase